MGTVAAKLIRFTVHGRQMVGVHTATDYEEIEVTTADGEKFYLDDSYLDQDDEEASQ